MAIHKTSRHFKAFEHLLIFLGDLLPYGVVFLLTLAVGYTQGLKQAGLFSLAYTYVAIVTALVSGPNLLSIKRRMPLTNSPGAVVSAAFFLRAMAIGGAALIVTCGLFFFASSPELVPLVALLFLGRLLETAVDGPATGVQYLERARDYFALRLMVFTLICSVTAYGVFTSESDGLLRIASFYILGCAIGLLTTLLKSRKLLTPVKEFTAELQLQATEFGKFFFATALYLAASRLQPIIITYFSGHEMAGQFAMVQNLFSALALAATGVAGVFFWSRNRDGAPLKRVGVPWRWLAWALPGGLVLGMSGGAVMDLLFLKPLNSPLELRTAAWLLCLSTPLLLMQSILSNLLVLLKRDREMLALAAVGAAFGLLLITALVHQYQLIGAALSVGASALLSSLLAICMVRRIHE